MVNHEMYIGFKLNYHGTVCNVQIRSCFNFFYIVCFCKLLEIYFSSNNVNFCHKHDLSHNFNFVPEILNLCPN